MCGKINVYMAFIQGNRSTVGKKPQLAWETHRYFKKLSENERMFTDSAPAVHRPYTNLNEMKTCSVGYSFRNVEDAKQRLCESRAFRQRLSLEAWGDTEWAPKTARAKAVDTWLALGLSELVWPALA